MSLTAPLRYRSLERMRSEVAWIQPGQCVRVDGRRGRVVDVGVRKLLVDFGHGDEQVDIADVEATVE